MVLVKNEETGEWMRPIEITTQQGQEIGKETNVRNLAENQQGNYKRAVGIF